MSNKVVSRAWIVYDQKRYSFPQCCDYDASCKMVRISDKVLDIVKDSGKDTFTGRHSMSVSLSWNGESLTGIFTDGHGEKYSVVAPSKYQRNTAPCKSSRVREKDAKLYYKLVPSFGEGRQVTDGTTEAATTEATTTEAITTEATTPEATTTEEVSSEESTTTEEATTTTTTTTTTEEPEPTLGDWSNCAKDDGDFSF